MNKWFDTLAAKKSPDAAQLVLAFIKGLCLSTFMLHNVGLISHNDLKPENLILTTKLARSLGLNNRGKVYRTTEEDDSEDDSKEITASNLAVKPIDYGLSSHFTPKPFTQGGTFEFDPPEKLFGWEWSIDSPFSDLYSMAIIFIMAICKSQCRYHSFYKFFYNAQCPRELEEVIDKAIDYKHLRVEKDKDSQSRLRAAAYKCFVIPYEEGFPMMRALITHAGPHNVAQVPILEEVYKVFEAERANPNSKVAKDIAMYSLEVGTEMGAVRESPLFKSKGDAAKGLRLSMAPVSLLRMRQEQFVQLLVTTRELSDHFRNTAQASQVAS